MCGGGNNRYRSGICGSFLGAQTIQLIVVWVSELKRNLLKRGEGIPSDCVTYQRGALGPGDCNVIVRLPGIV